MLNLKSNKRACLLLILALLAVNATASVRYVNLNNAAPVAPYTDWSTAATNIQDAIDAAAPGDTVLVTNGLYQTGGRVVAGSLTNRVVIDKAVVVMSVNGPIVTAISGYQVPAITNGYPQVGDGAVRCVYLTSGASLAGFTITNGATRYSDSDPTNAASGGGVWCGSSSSVVSNCVIINNAAYHSGGGVYQGSLSNCVLNGNFASGSGAGACLANLDNCMLRSNITDAVGGGADQSVLRQCILTGNVAEYDGGGTSLSRATNSTFIGNWANYSGGGAYQGVLQNCTLTGNWVYFQSGGYGGGGANGTTLNNCILTANQAGTGGGAYGGLLNNCTLTGNVGTNSGGGAAAATLNNCIVYFNTAGTNANFDPACTLNYCCTTPLPSTGVSNITADPQLAGTAHITAVSPCRAAGSAAYASGVDVDGETWLNPPSIGCDEYHANSVIGPLNPAFSLTYTSVQAGFVVKFGCTIQGETTGSQWDFGDGTVVTNQPYVAHAWTAVGDYPVVLTAFNQTYPGGVASTLVVHVVTRPTHYVDINNESPVAPFTSWSTAATNIQDAIDAAYVPGALVLVNSGHYQTGNRIVPGSGISNRVVIAKLLTLQSVNGPTVTSIDGGGILAGADVTNGAVLTGFTVFNAGYGVWSGPGRAAISNCILTLDRTGANNASLTDCLLSGNQTGASSCDLNACVITNNTVGGVATHREQLPDHQ